MAFDGFPPKVRYTPVPNPFFGPLLIEIDDLAEFKCTLRVFWLLYQKKGFPRFITLKELLADQTLVKALKATSAEREAVVKKALAMAVERGTLISGSFSREGSIEILYLLNTETDRRTLAGMEKGEQTPGPWPKAEPWQGTEERPNVFRLYEENIGVLTPVIAEELREAEQIYPPAWIEEALKEAVALNKRSWRYISRILERWATEGKDDGKLGRHSAATDREAYLRVHQHRLRS
ncbi:MAG: DnaD domain protein [Chloroflexi bacterium]|nr:DnaD domain protein [Chloroflexota bacterium]